jgi:hypothetical protein
MTTFHRFEDQWAVLLTTYRRDGRSTTRASARRLDGDDAGHAARALRRKHPVLQSVLVPLAHKLLRTGTAHFELRPR